MPFHWSEAHQKAFHIHQGNVDETPSFTPTQTHWKIHLIL